MQKSEDVKKRRFSGSVRANEYHKLRKVREMNVLERLVILQFDRFNFHPVI